MVRLAPLARRPHRPACGVPQKGEAIKTGIVGYTLGDPAAFMLLFWCPQTLADPGDNEVEAFVAVGLNGPNKLFALPAGKTEIAYGQPGQDRKWVKSIKTGKRVVFTRK